MDNNRLVLAPFLNTLKVRASPSLSASQYPRRIGNLLSPRTKNRVGLQKNVHNIIKSDPNKKTCRPHFLKLISMQCVIRPCRATFPPPPINSRACTATRHHIVLSNIHSVYFALSPAEVVPSRYFTCFNLTNILEVVIPIALNPPLIFMFQVFFCLYSFSRSSNLRSLNSVRD